VSLLKPLKEADRNKMAARLGVLEFGGGEPIVKQGEEGDGLYFLESGKANAYRNRQRVMAYESGVRAIFT
jgi:CRP-like cAMP-binding protein